MSRVKRILIVSIILVLIVIAIFAYRRGKARLEVIHAVFVSGNIEVTDVELSFRLPGWVESRLVAEGDVVTNGQLVARLDPTELIQQVELRKAELLAAQSVLAELTAGSRPQEINAAQAGLQTATIEMERTKQDFDRLSKLHQGGVINDQEFDKVKAMAEAAQARRLEAQERFALIKEGPRAETILQARARLEQARQGLAMAETRLGYTRLAAPLGGLVLSENVEAGEFVAAGTPIVTVGELSNVWLRAYINESDLGRVKVGQKVLVTADTYPDKEYHGQIAYIAPQAEFTPKNVQTKKERVKLVYRVKIVIPNPALELKPGMPADAKILLER